MGYESSTTGRLAWLLAHSGAVVLLPRSPFLYHFSARLLPWVHYVPLLYTSADLIEKVEWLRDHDDMAQQIVDNARNFGKSYLRLEDYFCYMGEALTLIGDIEKDTDATQDFPDDRMFRSPSAKPSLEPTATPTTTITNTSTTNTNTTTSTKA